MTSKQFTTLVNDPTSANMPGMQLLEDVVSRYPYFQSGQLLLACKFYIEENPAYPGQLKKAAAYAGDRRILRDLIGHAKKSGSPAVVPASRVIRMEPEIPDTESLPVIHERMTQEELLAIVKKRLAEIDAEKKRELIIPG